MLKTPVYEFGEFRLDTANRVLLREGAPVPLTPRVFETLLYMVEHRDTILGKDQLMEAVWPDVVVEENNLTQNISTLRRVFGEKPGTARFIVTLPRRGYRFVADVKTGNGSAVAGIGNPGIDRNISISQKPGSTIPATGFLRNDQRLTDREVFWVANILFVRFKDGFPTFRRLIKLSRN